MVVQIVDSVPGGETGGYEWETPSSKLTLRQIIGERVRREVELYNANRPSVYTGLVQPGETERMLNGERPRRELDPEHEIERACRAYAANGFVVFAGGEQIESLDAEIDLATAKQLEFIRLMPLAGG